MALKMYGKYNNAEERAYDAPARKAAREQRAKGRKEEEEKKHDTKTKALHKQI